MVHHGPFGETIDEAHRAMSRRHGFTSVFAHALHPPGGTPRAATRSLAEAMAGAQTLVLWTEFDGPGFEQAVRNADRTVLLARSDPGARIDRVLDTMQRPAAELTVALPSAQLTPRVTDPFRDRIAVRWWPLSTDAEARDVVRAIGRRGLVQGALRDSPVLGGLSEACLLELESNMQTERIASGHRLYDAGAPADTLYLVCSGRISARTADGARTDFGAGLFVGGLGLTHDERHRATARATRDSTLAAIGVERLQLLFARHPALRAALAEQVGSEVARLRTEAMADRASIAVVLPDRDPTWRERLSHLQAVLGGPRRCRIIDRQALRAAIGDESGVGPTGRADHLLRSWLARLEEQHRYLLYACEADDLMWASRCLGQADHTVLFARGDDDPRTLTSLGREGPRALALWWPTDTRPSGTAGWLEHDPTLSWHHLRDRRPDDLGRMVRRLLGRACGMVFGGASARCVAHLGVAAGLAASGLPLDTAVATSSGSMIAGVLALGLDPDETLARSLLGATGFTIGLSNVGPPFASLFSGRVATRLAQQTFGDARLEDLVVPLKITAVDLRSGGTCVLDRGPIWLASRAACTVPGMWAPLAIDGRMLVDGGLVDNFPYGALAAECAGGVTLISNLDAGYSIPFEGVPDYGPVLSGWRIGWDKLLRRGKVYPTLVGTVIESLVINGRAGSATLAERVDPRHIVIARPGIPKLDFFGLRQGPMVDEMLRIARDETIETLEQWQRTYGFDPARSTRIASLPDDVR